jgi:hypothetical protein
MEFLSPVRGVRWTPLTLLGGGPLAGPLVHFIRSLMKRPLTS